MKGESLDMKSEWKQSYEVDYNLQNVWKNRVTTAQWYLIITPKSPIVLQNDFKFTVLLTGGDAKYKFYFVLNAGAIMWNERLRRFDKRFEWRESNFDISTPINPS